ncbi:hypothetical protein [Candidatus Nitrosocaldus islandicus]|nr:hypothetical protein [Candidatus Nitrosocaldus islandicus]
MGMPTATATANKEGKNGKNNGKSSKVTLGKYIISKDRAIAKVATYDFLNPTEDFLGIIECKGNIRHIEKKGDMKQDLEVIDCHIIVGAQTREVEEETEHGTLVRRRDERFEDQDFSLVLNKAVLLSKFKKLQDELKDLTGKRIVIVGLGKVEDKNYYDYYVATEEKAREEGVLQVLQ